MTMINITPTGNTNEEPAVTQAVDNLGQPINDKGEPIEVKTEQKTEGQTVESLTKALNDTKAELTRLQQDKAKPKEDEGTEVKIQTSPKEAAADEAKAAVEQQGLDFDKYSNEISTSGKLTDESYQELASKGFPKEVVDDYIKGQQARVDQQTAEVSKVVGGEANLAPVLEWAAANLSAEEINIYNQAVAMGTAAAKLALEGIYSRYTSVNGKPPSLINTGSPSNTSNVFKSPYEMQEAMRDPRYWNDPDYQAEVAAKAERSHKAGTI
jgi:hypothetical protein